MFVAYFTALNGTAPVPLTYWKARLDSPSTVYYNNSTTCSREVLATIYAFDPPANGIKTVFMPSTVFGMATDPGGVGVVCFVNAVLVWYPSNLYISYIELAAQNRRIIAETHAIPALDVANKCYRGPPAYPMKAYDTADPEGCFTASKYYAHGEHTSPSPCIKTTCINGHMTPNHITCQSTLPCPVAEQVHPTGVCCAQCPGSDFCSIGANCHKTKATCTNLIDGYQCACVKGFSGDGVTCDDIDECSLRRHMCGNTTTCVNTPGSYRCDCSPNDGSYARINAYNCARAIVSRHIIDPAVIRCCSHASEYGMLTAKTVNMLGHYRTTEITGCTHGIVHPIGLGGGSTYSKPYVIDMGSIDDQEQIAMTFVDMLQITMSNNTNPQAPSVPRVEAVLQYSNGCERVYKAAPAIPTGNRTIVPIKIYLIQEESHSYRRVGDRRCSVADLNPIWVNEHFVSTPTNTTRAMCVNSSGPRPIPTITMVVLLLAALILLKHT